MFLASFITFCFTWLVNVTWVAFCLVLSAYFLYMSFSELFYKDHRPRDTLKFPRLAETMETIAKEGADAFYTGKIAKDLIKDVQERSTNCLYIKSRTWCFRNTLNIQDVVLSKYRVFACLHSLPLFFPDGVLSLEDLSTFTVRVSDAWSVQLGEYKMHFPPPPAGGAILSFILKLMHGRCRSQKKKQLC